MQMVPMRKLPWKNIGYMGSSMNTSSRNIGILCVNGGSKVETQRAFQYEQQLLPHRKGIRYMRTSSSRCCILRPAQIMPNSILKCHISSTGKDRVKNAFFYNKRKQHKVKHKKTFEEKAASKAKFGFKLDTTKPLSELLRYSDKFHSKRGPQSNRSFIKKFRITQYGKEAIPDADIPRSTEIDGDGNPIDPDLEGKSLDDWLASIDTTLTPEQKEKVAKLKHQITGAGPPEHGPIRSLYRDVPRPEEIRGTQNFFPKVPPNAQELVDYALSHIPDRAGPRMSREKKRRAHRWAQKIKDHVVKDIHKREAIMRKLVKKEREQALTKAYIDMAQKINAGEVASSGPHITSLHPCNNLSMYAPTNRKQRDYKRKIRMRDYRLPNPGGLKGLRIYDEQMKATTVAIKEEQRMYREQQRKKLARFRAMGANSVFRATNAHMHKRRQSGKH